MTQAISESITMPVPNHTAVGTFVMRGVTAKLTEDPTRAKASTRPKTRATVGPLNQRTTNVFCTTVRDSPPRPKMKRPTTQSG